VIHSSSHEELVPTSSVFNGKAALSRVSKHEPEEALFQIGAKADLESMALALKEETATMKEALSTTETPKGLHLECDWLMSNFEVRRDMRA